MLMHMLTSTTCYTCQSKPFLFMLCFMFYGLYVSLFVPASLNFDPITWTSYSPDYVTGAYWCSKFTMEFQGPLPPSGTIMTHHVMSTLSSQPHIAAVLGEYSGCGFTILFRTLCQILSHMNHYVSCLFMQDHTYCTLIDLFMIICPFIHLMLHVHAIYICFSCQIVESNGVTLIYV